MVQGAFLALFGFCLCSCQNPSTERFDPSQTLWFDEPAKAWTEALPVGNGRLGGMVYGGIDQEIIQFNEDTLWNGQPHDYAHPGAHEVLDDLRRLLQEGKQAEAHALGMEHFMSLPLRQLSYQPFGAIRLAFEDQDPAGVTDYRRSLDLGSATAAVSYQIGETRIEREVIASEPDQALLVRLRATGGPLNFKVGLTSPHDAQEIEVEDEVIIIRGRANDYPQSAQRGPVPYPESRLSFEARLRVSENDGEISIDSETLSIQGAQNVTLQLVAATSFVNYNDISGNPTERCLHFFDQLEGKTYKELKRAQLEDYQNLYQRVSLDLGTSDLSFRPTDQRVSTFKQDKDPNLVALVFQYGRYLLISSSRPGTQPANLQGIWNDQLLPPWDSKYTMNINVEMNYWPAEVTNLPECAQPLIRLIHDLSKTGKNVAREHYNLPGWVAHHNTDLWRGAAPINHSNHGIWPTGGAWLCQHLWWHYQFSGDKAFLRDTAYPILKEASRFFAAYLVP
ncbi:MAG TPA: glycoside hydrolase N-terminal domain-containing protein, partial [Opitutales bacterium]|nr:glycoside hydrolase N-terminal domain-containing protein [Opitutales bacterium]